MRCPGGVQQQHADLPHPEESSSTAPELSCGDAPRGRVVVTPGHLKRIIGALEDNLKRYEANFGDVRLIEPKDQVFH